MARLAGVVANRVLEALSNGQALPGQIARLSMEAGVPEQKPGITQLLVRNVSAEIAEKSAGASYPAFQIYCEKLTNSLREKFRTFSGTARMVIEARASQDRLEGLEDRLYVYVDAITNLLDASRGDLGQGMFYTGGYEVTFGAVKHGGKNFLQTAKVVFEVEISTD
jgi:hypothetical protein